jgi:hypothetical protein
MGFGSYDESEQENRTYNTDFEEGEGVATSDHDHAGEVEFDFGETTSDDLLDQLKEIKEE